MIGTPLSNRLHIGIFGRRNAGKSTLINALTGQDIAIVSSTPGTTTDPVYKAMEIHGVGPVVVIDTGGIDDSGDVGAQRVKKAYKVLNKTDIAVVLIDAQAGMSRYEERIIAEVGHRKIPLIIAVNKIDAAPEFSQLSRELGTKKIDFLSISASKGTGIDELRKKIAASAPDDFERKIILRDLLSPSDIVVMVAPLDIEAPKGRLKLPQVQTIRDVLDSDCSTIVVKESDLERTLKNLKTPPKLVIAESHVFGAVASVVPQDIPITSFSVLYARYKGDLDTLVAGARSLDTLKAGDKILISEACTHHPIGDDIGRVIIPNLLKKKLGAQPRLDYVAGYDFPGNVSQYRLVIHCGGCMLNRREMLYRISVAKEHAIPITNYGMVIAHLLGILDRVLLPFTNATHRAEEPQCATV